MVLRCLSQYRLRNVLQREAATFATTHQRFFFTVSAHMKRGYENQFSLPSQQVKALYPGVNLPPTLPQQAPKAPNVLGIVNSRSLNKGGWLLLLALWCLKRQHPQAMLYMVHPKWSQDALSRALVGVLGLKRRVKVLPFQKDMTAFYEAIDYLVLPSLHEAFGLVGLEAMAHGVPAVVSSTAGVAEVVTHGENGFVFHRLQQPVKALANTLHTALTQSPGAYAALQQGAVATAQRHSWQGFAQGLLSQLLPLKESSSHA
jgi:glycosyltransferase involved in cell wall biosynthesis